MLRQLSAIVDSVKFQSLKSRTSVVDARRRMTETFYDNPEAIDFGEVRPEGEEEEEEEDDGENVDDSDDECDGEEEYLDTEAGNSIPSSSSPPRQDHTTSRDRKKDEELELTDMFFMEKFKARRTQLASVATATK